MFHFFNMYPPPDAVRLFSEAPWQNKRKVKHDIRVCTKSLLFTWQGPWGVLSVPDGMLQWRMPQLQQWLRKCPAVLDVWQECISLMDVLCSKCRSNLECRLWSCTQSHWPENLQASECTCTLGSTKKWRFVTRA